MYILRHLEELRVYTSVAVATIMYRSRKSATHKLIDKCPLAISTCLLGALDPTSKKSRFLYDYWRL